MATGLIPDTVGTHSHDAAYVNVSGDTMTGDLFISNALMNIDRDTANLFLNNRTANAQVELWWRELGANRWALYKDAAQNLAFYSDLVGNTLVITRSTGQVSILGNLALVPSTGNTFLLLDSVTSQIPVIRLQNQGVTKWDLSRETGDQFSLRNAGSVVRFIVDQAGVVTLSGLAGTGSRMVEANASGALSAAKVPGMDYLYSAVFSNTSGIITPNIFTSAYTNYHIDLSAVTLNTAAAELDLRFGVNGTPDQAASSYAYHQMRMTSAGVVGQSASSAVTSGVLLSGLASGTISDSALSLDVFTPFVAAAESRITFLWSAIYGGIDWYGGWGNIQYKGTAKSQNCLQIFPSTGLITALTINVYGKRDS